MITSEEQARAWLERIPEYERAAALRLEQFERLLKVENTRQNLVARATLDIIWQRHFVDSAQLLKYVPRETGAWLDLGTGAGFPGLVIACIRPTISVHLVESRTRRIEWLRAACDALQLPNVTIHASRLEKLETFKVSVISARAFAPLDRLLGLAARFSTKETTWLLPKGRSAAQDLNDLRGWAHMFHVEPSLTEDGAGVVVGKLIGQKG